MKLRKAQYRAVYALKNKYCVKSMLKILQIPQSSYYKWLKSIKKSDKDLIMYELIKEIQNKTKQTYGYRRIKLALLKQHGLVANNKKVLRLMNKYNLLSVIRRKYLYRHAETIYSYENILNRQFQPLKPNEKWCTDISYIKTKERMLYISAIRDCYDGYIVSYRLSVLMNNNLVMNTVKDALKKENICNGILHSDRGFQYQSIEYQNILKANKLIPSMSRGGTPLDNSPIESFFGTLKTECIYLEKLETIEQAKEIIEDYIDFYNNCRIQLRYNMAPAEFRKLSLTG